MLVWLFLAVPWVCLQFVIVVFPDHTHLLRGVIQKYTEKCHYFHNFNANYIIFVHNQAKFMPIWNLVFKII